MKKNRKTTDLPSAVYAVICLVVFTFLAFILDAWFVKLVGHNNSYAYLAFGLLSATACFVIIRSNPRSIWYVPLIINALLVFSTLVGDFDKYYVPGWILTVLMSFAGYFKGKRDLVSKQQPES